MALLGVFSFLFLLLAASPLTSGNVIQKRDTLVLRVPPTTPRNASKIIDRGYVGLAISTHTFPDYSGSLASPNTFSRNLIQTIADRTGSPVRIRVGGTSGDYSVYVPTQAAALLYPAGYVQGAPRTPRGITIGPSWYEGFQNFPGVQWTYMAHLANNSAGMLQNSVAGVQEMLRNVGSNLEYLEIGNEINFYTQEGARPANYGVTGYINDWMTYSAAIQNNALAGTQYANRPIWRAMGYYNNICPFCVANTFDQGFTRNIMSVALHNYMVLGQKPLSLQGSLMNHGRVVAQLNPFKGPIAYLAASAPSISFQLSEINSATYSVESTRPVLGVFGSALWMIDYLLYGASINIARVNVQQSTSFSYSAWRPIPFLGLPAAVLPPYYAHPFVADVIGNTGNIRLANINMNTDIFTAYVVYDATSRKVLRIALINLLAWSPSSGTPRPSTTVPVSVGNVFTGPVRVDRLTAPSADTQDAGRISWKGASWTFASNGRPVQTRSDSSTVQARQGRFSVVVKASEAVMLTLHD